LDRQLQTSDKKTSAQTFKFNPKLLENRGLSALIFVLLETIFEQKCLLTAKNLWEGKWTILPYAYARTPLLDNEVLVLNIQNSKVLVSIIRPLQL